MLVTNIRRELPCRDSRTADAPTGKFPKTGKLLNSCAERRGAHRGGTSARRHDGGRKYTDLIVAAFFSSFEAAQAPAPLASGAFLLLSERFVKPSERDQIERTQVCLGWCCAVAGYPGRKVGYVGAQEMRKPL